MDKIVSGKISNTMTELEEQILLIEEKIRFF